MRFVVTQMGARRGYAVPTILEKAGLLERFYTDLAGNVGLGPWLVGGGRFLGWRRAADRLAHRRVPAAIRRKTIAFSGRSVWKSFARLGSSSDPGARFHDQLRWSRALGLAAARRGFGRASHLYSMLGEFGPVTSAAKSLGLTVVNEVYIRPSAENVLRREQLEFPGWEAASPDLDRIRGRFTEQAQLFAQSDFFLCPSETVRRDLGASYGIAEARSTVVRYGMDARWLALPTRPTPGRVLFVGTAGLRKGVHYLAKAAEILVRRGRTYEFRVAGEVTRQVAKRPECQPLTFLGPVPHFRIQAEFASADVFVLPTLAEGSSESTYEALGCGLPVITTEAAGSVTRHGVDGWIVPERDPQGLARAIERTVEDRVLRADMSRAARSRARDYTLERYGERLVTALTIFTR